MTAKLTDRNLQPSDRNVAHPGAGCEEGVAAEIMKRLAEDWNRLQKPDAAIPETEGWFPPSRPRRGCEDC